MKRWLGLFISILFILALTSFGKTSFLKTDGKVPDFLRNKANDKLVWVPSPDSVVQERRDYIFLGKTYTGFKEALGFKESQGKYDTINKLGYLGKYQFGGNTLKLLGIDTVDGFLGDAALQEKAFMANIARNKWILRKDIKRFSGKKINGVIITESGIVAAAHLAGAGNVKKYLRSYGKKDVSDIFGSSIYSYMKRFSGYNISQIPQKRNATIFAPL